MNTIILSPKMPPGIGGRPMHLGHFIFNEKKSGIFVGYDESGRKVGVKPDDLERCLKSVGGTYKVHVSMERVGHHFSFNRFMVGLIPQGMKNEITKETI